MKSTPSVPTKLLERLAPRLRRESLIGDLAEGYRNGRSTWWFWRQAFSAILLGAARDIRDHPLLAVRALVIGFVSFYAFRWLAYALPGNLLVALTNGGLYVGEHWLTLPTSWGLYGWSVIYWSIFWASGWVVGRLHRSCQGPLVLLYLLAVLLVKGPRFAGWMWGRPTLMGAPLRAVLFTATFVVGIAISVLVGGLWGVSRDQPRDRDLV